MPIWKKRPAAGEVPPHLSKNLISYVGWVISCAVFTLMSILIAADIIFHKEEPYNSLVTYMILPGVLMSGIMMILGGILLEWRRRHKAKPGEYPALPVIDINQGWQRRRVTIGLMIATLFFGLSAIGTYRAYHFTESPTFCGLVCHQVMRPEHTAYQYSAHARVSCAECHIGSGAEWYVKAKFSGLRQVWAMATHTYHTPIETPVKNLRPAQGTCEQCHWPEKFSDSLEKTIWHFSPDEANTAVRYNLLLKVGGGVPEAGMGHGIHWHINPQVTVRYWARDRQRLDIPYIEVRNGKNPPRVYRTPDCPDPLPKGAELRRMDCIDCHNRPAHIYRSPRQLVDLSLANGILDTSLPYLKRYATDLLEQRYPDTPAAMTAIAKGFEEKYQGRSQGPRGKELLQRNVDWLQTLYKRNFFPEQGVDWRAYPNHLGHYEFPGCMRCHDDKHQSADKHTIPSNCNLCHEFLDQAEGEAAFGPITYHGGPFQHPRKLGDIWKGHNCADCHGILPAKHEGKPEPGQVAKATAPAHP
jgi:hypothetical protein